MKSSGGESCTTATALVRDCRLFPHALGPAIPSEDARSTWWGGRGGGLNQVPMGPKWGQRVGSVRPSPPNGRSLVRSDQCKRESTVIASISHAEGRWFDPSRDHEENHQVAGLFASWYVRSIRRNPRVIRRYPHLRSAVEPVEGICHTIEVGVVKVCVGVRGHHDRRVAHCHLQQFHLGTRRSSQRRVTPSVFAMERLTEPE